MSLPMPRTRKPSARADDVARLLSAGPATRVVIQERLMLPEGAARLALGWLRRYGYITSTGQRQHLLAEYSLAKPLVEILDAYESAERAVSGLARSPTERGRRAREREKARLAEPIPTCLLEQCWGTAPKNHEASA